MKTDYSNGFQIETDGITLWVNSSQFGSVGRFSPRGVDVHSPANDSCVGCGPTPDWDDFVIKMFEIHGVDLSSWRQHLSWLN